MSFMLTYLGLGGGGGTGGGGTGGTGGTGGGGTTTTVTKAIVDALGVNAATVGGVALSGLVQTTTLPAAVGNIVTSAYVNALGVIATSPGSRPVVQLTNDAEVAVLGHAEKTLVFPNTETYTIRGVTVDGGTVDMNWPVPCTFDLISRNVNPVAIQAGTGATILSRDGGTQTRSIDSNGTAHLTIFSKPGAGSYQMVITGDLTPLVSTESVVTSTVTQAYVQALGTPMLDIVTSPAYFDVSHANAIVVFRNTASVYNLVSGLFGSINGYFSVEFVNATTGTVQIAMDANSDIQTIVGRRIKSYGRARLTLYTVDGFPSVYTFVLTGDLQA